MKCTRNIIALILLASGSAQAQDAATTYGVTLAPGETIVEVIRTPSTVQIPAAPEYGTVPYVDAPAFAPPAEIDRVTGLPRNEAGWSGDTGEPAGIGCFPQGVCAHLN